MKISSLFKNKEMWPSCKHPRTLSFRAEGSLDEMFKTVNCVFLDPDPDHQETPDTYSSWFTNSSCDTASLSTDTEEYLNTLNLVDTESLETVVRGVVGSDEKRLFFEPGSDTSSILEETKPGGFPFKESFVLAMESDDPYHDFKRSMEEMVESHGVKDWDCLEELLGWYLRVNGKKHHGLIIGAFVDLLVGSAPPNTNSSNNNSCPCPPSSSSTSSASPSSRCPCSDSASFTSAASCFSSSSSSSPTSGFSALSSVKSSSTEIEEEAA